VTSQVCLSAFPSLPSQAVFLTAGNRIKMPPRVDLVVVFRAVNKPQSKQQALQDARKAEEQYSRLLEALKGSGLRVVGRRGETQGHLLVFVSCPLEKLANLIRIERQVLCAFTCSPFYI
jgi:hypothetical protein